MEQNLNCFLLLKIFGLNPKPLRSACEVKAYILLIAIRSYDGDIKPDGLLGTFEKSRLMPASSFSFTLPRLIFVTHKLHHNTSLHMHSS